MQSLWQEAGTGTGGPDKEETVRGPRPGKWGAGSKEKRVWRFGFLKQHPSMGFRPLPTPGRRRQRLRAQTLDSETPGWNPATVHTSCVTCKSPMTLLRPLPTDSSLFSLLIRQDEQHGLRKLVRGLSEFSYGNGT